MVTQTLPQQQAKIAKFIDFLPVSETRAPARARQVYEDNKHQVYSLAFWMTDNELQAEELSVNIFRRAFLMGSEPGKEALDRALVAELRESLALGILTLHCDEAKRVLQVRANTKRVHLERAVVQLPATERLIFLLHDVLQREHTSIARLLGIAEAESRHGLHQARLRVRELLDATSQRSLKR